MPGGQYKYNKIPLLRKIEMRPSPKCSPMISLLSKQCLILYLKHCIMRFAGAVIILFFSFSLQAQSSLPLSAAGYNSPFFPNSQGRYIYNAPNKKWSLSRDSGISAGYLFFKGGSANYISAPIGLQLNRRLNNNLYAFGGVSVNPTYFNFSQPLPLSGMNKAYYSNGMFGANNFGIYPKAELGLMYMNDEKTFSISGSISVQRGGYTTFPYQPMISNSTNPVIRHN